MSAGILAPYRIAPRTMAELVSDIKADSYRVHDEARRAYTRITGHILPQPGDRAAWTSSRTAAHLAGTVDEVILLGGEFHARIDADRTSGEQHRTRYTIAVGSITGTDGAS